MAESAQFGKLSIDIKATADVTTYTFVGDVDEHFRQKDVPRLVRPKIVFVLEDVNNFNSIGVREWIYLVREFGDLGELVFSRCSVTMIDQINMVPDSLGSGRVDSFFAPYFCKCGGEVNRLIVVEENLAKLQSKQAPTLACEKCKNTLEFDALEESYFLFAEAALPRAS